MHQDRPAARGERRPDVIEWVNATTKALIATRRAMDVEVSPRYGTWNSRRGLATLVSGGLAQTAAEIAKG